MDTITGYHKQFLEYRGEMFLELLLKNMATILFILFILLVWYLIDKAIPYLMMHIFQAAGERARNTVYKDDEIRRAWLMYRMSTLRQLTTQMLRVLLATVMCFVILNAIGINIKPILAGIGIAGLGISLAAQNLIRDFINGVLIIVEDQYNVNDWIQIGNYQGTVEHFTLRLTRLRSLEGNLIIIPNSTIQDVINYTKDWSYTAIYVTIPYEGDYAAAKKILMELADETVKQGDPKIFPNPVFNGITEYAQNGIKFRCFIKTAPGYQWRVGYRFREELHKRYTEAGIKFAYPAVSNYLESSDPAVLAEIAKSRELRSAQKPPETGNQRQGN
ncbi:mechanosensitive ion channel family protein [Cloacibacillus porcorum]|uniref:mechanosensitive ion channel family protein n=1 Tax=Cloacibacillus porcorum TaxID=1197717 RepID=UPI0023F4D3EE|nr:mechanosensitive ion channel family protein [Cloacibacillus porcorum]MDD7648240.1 mechanosensitive ion channel family protein [Cloacibacillus porcorum]MDY4094165.1 mechanosensitive ion channel family protein [Cloacibacillus porcorum]